MHACRSTLEDPTGICVTRNVLLERATGDYIWFVDDDSRLDARNLEHHLRVMAAYGADVSVGPATTKGRPELAREHREIACTFMDCGTTVCTRALLEKVGGFDLQFNEHLAGEDGDLGVRFVRAGGLMVNNPLARRFHYLAPVGGARTSRNNLHRFQRLALGPRPAQSVYYMGRRHFGPEAAREATFLSWALWGWRRKDDRPATRAWKLGTLTAELGALPLSLLRLARSVQLGQRLLDGGPRIPPLR